MRYAHHERLRAYSSIEQLVAKVRAHDHHLAMVARGRIEQPRADRPDGYPRGGDGSHGSGVSNPTLGAVEQREVQADRLRVHAEDAFGAVFEALKALVAADAHRAKALEPPRAPELAVRRPDDAMWCVSCMRERRDPKGQPVRGTVIAFSQRTPIMKRSRRDLCSWCLKEWEASDDDNAKRRLPDIRLVMWRAEHAGQTVTERVRVFVLGKQPA